MLLNIVDNMLGKMVDYFIENDKLVLFTLLFSVIIFIVLFGLFIWVDDKRIEKRNSSVYSHISDIIDNFSLSKLKDMKPTKGKGKIEKGYVYYFYRPSKHDSFRIKRPKFYHEPFRISSGVDDWDDISALIFVVTKKHEERSYTTQTKLQVGFGHKKLSGGRFSRSTYALHCWVIDVNTLELIEKINFPPPKLKAIYTRGEQPEETNERDMYRWVDSLCINDEYKLFE